MPAPEPLSEQTELAAPTEACGGGGGGCGFETRVPASDLSPLCGCGLRASWLLGRWWCAASLQGGGRGDNQRADDAEDGAGAAAGDSAATSGGGGGGGSSSCGCGFELDGSALAAPAAEPFFISHRDIEAETARATAALRHAHSSSPLAVPQLGSYASAKHA